LCRPSLLLTDFRPDTRRMGPESTPTEPPMRKGRDDPAQGAPLTERNSADNNLEARTLAKPPSQARSAERGLNPGSGKTIPPPIGTQHHDSRWNFKRGHRHPRRHRAPNAYGQPHFRLSHLFRRPVLTAPPQGASVADVDLARAWAMGALAACPSAGYGSSRSARPT
jgi:hypothetical protein